VHGLSNLWRVGAQVFERDQAAAFLHARCDGLCDLSLVESARPALGDLLERAREVRLDEPPTRLERDTVERIVDAHGFGKATFESRPFPAHHADVVGADREPLPREPNGRRQDLREVHRAVALQRERETRDHSGCADGERAVRRSVFGHAGPHVHVAVRGAGCRLSPVDRHHLAVRKANQDEHAAANAGRKRLRYTDRKRRSHRRVDRVAARLEHLHTCACRIHLRGHHHPVARTSGRAGGSIDRLRDNPLQRERE